MLRSAFGCVRMKNGAFEAKGNKLEMVTSRHITHDSSQGTMVTSRHFFTSRHLQKNATFWLLSSFPISAITLATDVQIG